MIEEYENWEDSIRRTFIELASYMEKNSDPLEFVIEFAWANGCDLFVVNNAKDQLKKLQHLYTLIHDTEINSHEPIDSLISLCELAIDSGRWHISRTEITAARDNLNQLRATKKALAQETYTANDFATEEMNLYLETAKELGDLQKNLAHPVAWAKINDSGDLYDLRLQNNPYNDQTKIVPLYRINYE